MTTPTLAPHTADEISRLLKGYTGPVMVIGGGSGANRIIPLSTDFKADDASQPELDVIMISTERLNRTFTLSSANQTVAVDAGWSVKTVNDRLRDAGFVVPALIRFHLGTVGGRLASVSSRPEPRRSDGWIQSLLGLDVVLPNGEIVELGNHCIKDVAGYDMRHLFTGSCGMAGVIVGAIFRCWRIGAHPIEEPLEKPQDTVRLDPQWRRFFDPQERMR